MDKKILIVEDEFIVANDLRLTLQRSGYLVCGIANSVAEAQRIIERERPGLVLLDIQLKGPLTGIDLARKLKHQRIAFVYLSANSNQRILEEAKLTEPYGFLVKPFREKDVLITLDIAWYRHRQKEELDKASPKAATTASSGEPLAGIIGQSPAIRTVLDHLARVAPTDTSVLILGESGVGKEQIAHGLHQLSPRRNKPFIKVNCAALPAALIESELFGHEKGAFTGAAERRIGKFEQADGGSIFLDEIGELPLDLQVKLLRVLQEREIERVGGKAPIKVDVRVIAATNRQLEKEIAEGRFRLDLYYRLYVFPLRLPPLRERKEDIPLLAAHFLDRYAQKVGKTVTGIAPHVLREFQAYDWPGNVRELEHLLERGILLADGPVLQDSHLPATLPTVEPAMLTTQPIKTIEENERDHILAVLKQCNGKVWGPGGAAELLGVPPTTLHSKMKKLGIKKAFMG